MFKIDSKRPDVEENTEPDDVDSSDGFTTGANEGEKCSIIILVIFSLLFFSLFIFSSAKCKKTIDPYMEKGIASRLDEETTELGSRDITTTKAMFAI